MEEFSKSFIIAYLLNKIEQILLKDEKYISNFRGIKFNKPNQQSRIKILKDVKHSISIDNKYIQIKRYDVLLRMIDNLAYIFCKTITDDANIGNYYLYEYKKIINDVNLQIIKEINRCTIECTIGNIKLKCYNREEY
jgi:hypothetical protein